MGVIYVLFAIMITFIFVKGDNSTCPPTCLKCHTPIYSDGNQTQSTNCSECHPGLYGQFCGNTCSIGCLNDTCDLSLGKCEIGCKSGFTGQFCETCLACKFGANCDKDCTSNGCERGVACSAEDGVCASCIIGFYGKHCNQTCSKSCLIGFCDRDTGVCLSGCVQHNYGDQCCSRSPLCIKCSSNYECYKCVEGFYGHQCDQCNHNCLGGCDSTTGRCLNGCVHSHLRGPTCNQTCSHNCKNVLMVNNVSVCHNDNTTCKDGCMNGWYGPNCTKECSGYCQGFACDDTSGVCLLGCVAGYKGIYCNKVFKETPTKKPSQKIHDNHAAIFTAVGVVVAVLVVTIFLIVIFKYTRRLNQQRRAAGDLTTLDEIGEELEGRTTQWNDDGGPLFITQQKENKQTSDVSKPDFSDKKTNFRYTKLKE